MNFLKYIRRLASPIRREDLTFIAVDTETTGLDPSMCGLVQVGWQPVLRGRLLTALSVTVKPAYHGNPGQCVVDDDDFCRRNDELWKHEAFSRPAEGALGMLRAAGEGLRTESGVRPFLAWHNAPFDVSFIVSDQAIGRKELRWMFQESEGPFSRRMVDTQAMVQPLVMRGQLKSQSLKGVCELLGVKPGNHTAGDDARATAECVIRLLTEGWV